MKTGVIICAGTVYDIAAPIVNDAQGMATITLKGTLVKAVTTGEAVAQINARMYFRSAAPKEVWERAGGDLVRKNTLCDVGTWQQMAAVYPDPPQVEIVSNNEVGCKVGITEAAGSWHWATR